MAEIKVAPSILSADFSCLDREIKKVELAGADMLHIDIMDGHFVPNITIGPVVVKDIRRITKLPLDVHLMIDDPKGFIGSFIEAGSDMITVHIETVSKNELKALSQEMRRKGIKLGISLNPKTPLAKISRVLDLVDFVLVMTVNPGYGGQKFMPEVIHKIENLRGIYRGDISVDGGINNKWAVKVIKAGANILAAGSYIFNSQDYNQAIRSLKWQN